jgi:hypothetical protein
VRTPRSPDLSEGTTEANDLSSPPRITCTGVKYLKAVLVAERKGVAALRSVADMLSKSTEGSIKSIAIYRHELDKVAVKKQLSLVICTTLYSRTKCAM